ncbi:oxygen-dependent protoporphyrinogen oxidase, partial [Teratosphaeriaceae sp. CCFEE 6253]
MKGYKWDPVLQETLLHNSVFTLKDGLQGLVDGLTRYLVGRGNVEFRTDSPVEAVELSQGGIDVTARKSVDASPAPGREGERGDLATTTYRHAISTLFPEHLSVATRPPMSHSRSLRHRPLIPTIAAVTVMTVNLYFPTPAQHPPGFGYVIPSATPFDNNPERALGVVFDTAYSPSPEDLD